MTLVILTSGACGHADSPPLAFCALAEQNLAGLDRLPDDDADGYGELAWGTSYGMMALNVLYEATGDTKYLDT
ncbi:MAG: hypothetical protein FJX75_26420, partial [Armatimonadetes bacterium]|nr:hypothetical protein [Armatimonadota bacterium]